MVHRTLRKRRSKRSMKRSIKRYRRHAKTRIRRNMYRKKNKKTQRGGFTFSKLLPEGYKFTTTGSILKRGLYSKLPDSPPPVSPSPPTSLSPPPVSLSPLASPSPTPLKFYVGEESFLIGEPTQSNTLDGKRFLKAELKVEDNNVKAYKYHYTKNEDKDGDKDGDKNGDPFNMSVTYKSTPVKLTPYYSYYVIISVTDENGNITVTAKKIVSTQKSKITLSSEEYTFTLRKDDKGNYEAIGGKGIIGNIRHNGMYTFVFKIESFTPIDDTEIQTSIGNSYYTNPIIHEYY